MRNGVQHAPRTGRSRSQAHSPRRLLISCASLGLALLWATNTVAAERIVSLDSVITETLFALDEGASLVAADSSSQYLPHDQQLPNVGYKRSLSAEGILALTPDLILATEDAGPPEVLTQIASTGVKLVTIPTAPSIDGLHTTLRAIAAAVGQADKGEAVLKAIDAELAQARHQVASLQAQPDFTPPRVFFLLTIGSGTDMSAGRDTAVDSLLQLAGAENVMHASLSGYQTITAEAVVAAAPDVILVTQRNFDGLGGAAGVLQRAGLAATPAGQTGRIVILDGLLLTGFGPRAGQAVEQLAQQLHVPSLTD